MHKVKRFTKYWVFIANNCKEYERDCSQTDIKNVDIYRFQDSIVYSVVNKPHWCYIYMTQSGL